MLLKDLEVVLQIATGWNKTTVAFSLYQEKIRMVEDEKEPRDVEKSNRRVEVTKEEGKAEENK